MDPINNFEEFSIGTETSFSENTQVGGFFWSKSNKDNEMALKWAREGAGKPLVDLMREDMVTDYTLQDEDGNTVLHYLIVDLGTKGSVPLRDVQNVLERNDVSSFINIQNNNGDTPLHVAVKLNLHDVATMLIDAGADVNIRNNDNKRIVTDSEFTPGPDVSVPLGQGFNIPESPLSGLTPEDLAIALSTIPRMLDERMRRAREAQQPDVSVARIEFSIQPVGKDLPEKLESTEAPAQTTVGKAVERGIAIQQGTMSTEEIGLPSMLPESTVAEAEAEETELGLPEQLPESTAPAAQETELGLPEQLPESTAAEAEAEETELGLPSMLPESTAPGPTGAETVMKISSDGDYPSMLPIDEQQGGDSTAFTRSIITYDDNQSMLPINKQRGGDSTAFTRSLRTYDDTMYGGRAMELARLIKNQATDIHIRTIEKIVKILKVDKPMAKAYKSVLWDIAKEKFTDLSNLDKSVEMEKMANKEFLESKMVKDKLAAKLKDREAKAKAIEKLKPSDKQKRETRKTSKKKKTTKSKKTSKKAKKPTKSKKK